ncbi:protease Do-like 10 [Perkinsela sp. CCAP 1560/4]|nr:protease Do-like 10 [Perkinsela sp. CCAP 1560/4]|eukprot:KNH02444.1 protease Do-like 10 [Perkinsela sp. CCAP 1560/4]
MMHATKGMCAFCWDKIRDELTPGTGCKVDRGITDKECALFVSLKETTTNALRGCIGTFGEKPCSDQLNTYAIQCAFHDDRFYPVSKNEIGSLTVSVTLLSNFTPIDHCLDWIVGKHGVLIEFQDPGTQKRLSAVFLPSVMTEKCWDQQETISQLMRKAGYEGLLRDVALTDISAITFQGSTAELSYKDYIADWQKSPSRL